MGLTEVLPNKSSTAVWPRTTTIPRLASSSALMKRPRVRLQLRTLAYSSVTPLMLGEAVLPEYDTLTLLALNSGATSATDVARPRIASTSALVSCRTLCCRPPREKPKLVPAVTVSRLDPRDANWLTTCAWVPCPTATSAITAPTPITTPSMVRKERILCTTSDCAATRRTMNHFLMCAAPLSAHRRTVCPSCRRRGS